MKVSEADVVSHEHTGKGNDKRPKIMHLSHEVDILEDPEKEARKDTCTILFSKICTGFDTR
jgi:argininosuccinate synthase